MSGMYAIHSNLKRPEACPGGADVVQAQLYCYTRETYDHPFPITAFQADLPADIFVSGTRITELLKETHAAAVEFADTEAQKDHIRSLDDKNFIGITVSQYCSFMTDGFVHGMERVMRPVILSVGPCEPVHKQESTVNVSAPWMSFVSTVEGEKPLMVGTMPLTHQEREEMRLEVAVPVFLQDKRAILGYKRPSVPCYMGAHVLKTHRDGGTDHQVLETIIPKVLLAGQTLGRLGLYSV